MFKVAVLISGTGTTLKAILDDALRDNLYEIALVIADREAGGLKYAKEKGIPYIILSRDTLLSENIHLLVKDMDLVVLAGFLSILEGPILKDLKGKIINLHPSLLPKFGGKGMYGSKVHQAVFDSQMTISGCTVHYVTNKIDGGGFILQRIVGIRDLKSAKEVAEKVTSVEKGALIDAIRLIAKEEDK